MASVKETNNYTCVEELEYAFQAMLAPIVSENPALSLSHGADHRPTSEYATKKFTEALVKCETFFNQYRTRLLHHNPHLTLLTEIEQLENRIKMVDETTQNVMAKCSQWKKVVDDNRNFLINPKAQKQQAPQQQNIPPSSSGVYLQQMPSPSLIGTPKLKLI